MSQDTSHLQVIEKFSFIYTLTYSKDKKAKQIGKNLSVDIQQLTDTPQKESCDRLVHSSSSDSVTLSSILGLPNLTAVNGSGLCLLDKLDSDYSLDFSEQIKLSEEERKNDSFISKHLGKIVFALSSSYLIGVVWWLTGHSYYGKLFPFSTLRTLLNMSEQQISAADLQFIDYLKRSLENIEHQKATQLSDSATKAENSDVVYIPVYNLNNNNSVSPTNSFPSTFPLNSSINSPLPIPVVPPPPPVQSPTSTLPASPMMNSSSTAVKPSSPTNTKKSSSASTSSLKDYTLIGIVELGKRSAALFKVDGLTKRIWVGEELNNKGWILDSVVNQKAKITRQGETRYLSVGEKF